jgi:DNA sulfur modification protein DndC
LDKLEGVLRQYAFRNEQEALEFAKSSASSESEPDGDASDGTTMIA